MNQTSTKTEGAKLMNIHDNASNDDIEVSFFDGENASVEELEGEECEDSLDDISFYIGDELEGFCTSASLGDSDISVSDSEYDCDDDDDWSFDCECLDDSEEALVGIGGEEGYCTDAPGLTKNVSTTTLWRGQTMPQKKLSTTLGADMFQMIKPKNSSVVPKRTPAPYVFSPRESLPSPKRNVSTTTTWRGESMPQKKASATQSLDPFLLFRPKTSPLNDAMPDMARLSHESLASLDSMENLSSLKPKLSNMHNEEWSNPASTEAPSALLQRVSFANKLPLQASVDEKDINDFCTTAAKVGGAVLLLSVWSSKFVAQTRTGTNKGESAFSGISSNAVNC